MAQKKRDQSMLDYVESSVEVRQSFIDRTVIALFARGYPQDKLFERAELLWRLREENRNR